jgi:hypothetical protein
MKKYLITGTLLIATLGFAGQQVRAQETKPSTSSTTTQNKTQFEEWNEDFTGDKLDEKKWEKFTFEGGSGGKLEVKDGTVKIRSLSKTRAGIRTKEPFAGDLFVVEARVSKVGAAYPEPGSDASTLGFGGLTILFDGSGRNRIEWIFTSDGTFEAWAVADGRAERIDNRKLGTKMKNPVLMIVRKGDEFSFYINDPKAAPQDAQLGLKATVKNMPKTFHVMLYGYSSSENNWDSVLISTPKQN